MNNPSLRIALIGYGRMGKMIERIALERGHTIVARIDEHSTETIESLAELGADVAIEFSRPEAAMDNCSRCIRAGLPVVSGTTGWLDGVNTLRDAVERDPKASFVWSSNFSVGVNVFTALTRHLARLLNMRDEYRPTMSETHHIHKLDAPSGTAITLAEAIIGEHSHLTSWAEISPEADKSTIAPDVLPITSFREGEVPGTHSITYRSSVDQITLTHEAFGREGFALGAVVAAEYAARHTGYHTMADILGLA